LRGVVRLQRVLVGRRGDAREPVEESAETGAKFVVHPAVDERVVTAVAHRQPVAEYPHRLNVSVGAQIQEHSCRVVILCGHFNRPQSRGDLA